MRCYFFSGGHIKDAADLKAASDSAAINESHMLFKTAKSKYEGFEVWDCARVVYRHQYTGAKTAISL